MIWMDILCWISLGAITGLWATWFRQRHSRMGELLFVGMLGGLVGGAFGRAIGEPYVGRTSLAAIFLAVVVGAIAVYVDIRIRRSHPGPNATLDDEREDVHEPSDAHSEA